MSSSNDRIEIRKNFRSIVGVISDHWDEVIEYLCQDLCPRGAFLKTNFPLCVGENVLLTFRLPDIRDEFNLFGKIVRVDMPKRKNDWGCSGMAVSFAGITARERFLLRQGLRKVPPKLPFHVRLQKNLAKKAA
jgi:hypothetical protein